MEPWGEKRARGMAAVLLAVFEAVSPAGDPRG